MSRTGFDADARTKERESGPVKIGGATYHPARLTNARLRQVRRMSRAVQVETKRLARDTEEYREAYDDAIADGLSEEDARKQAELMGMTNEQVLDVTQKSLTEQLHILLVTDDMQPPDEATIRKHLEEDLDFRDVDGLMTYLLGNEDPTPPASTTNGSPS